MGLGYISKEDQNLRDFRKLRPFRWAKIVLTQIADIDPITISYLNGINDFGGELILSASGGGASYELSIDTQYFKNPNKVFAACNFVHSSGNPKLLSSYFSDTTRSTLILTPYDFTVFGVSGIQGDAIITIYEYYE